MISFLKDINHRENLISRMLPVVVHKNRIIPADKRNGGLLGLRLACIFSQIDSYDMTVVSAQFGDNIPSVIGGSVVDQNNLISVYRICK